MQSLVGMKQHMLLREPLLADAAGHSDALVAEGAGDISRDQIWEGLECHDSNRYSLNVHQLG